MNKPKFNRIKAVLAEKGISNRDLAERLGVTEGTVSTWSRNFKQPRLEMLFEIAKCLKTEPRDLLNTLNAVEPKETGAKD